MSVDGLKIVDKRTNILYSLAIVISLAGNNLWVYFGLPTYYIGEALSVLILHLILLILVPKPKHWLFIAGTFLSFNRLVDEIFGDPTEFNTFEYVNAVIMIMFFILRHIYRKQKHY